MFQHTCHHPHPQHHSLPQCQAPSNTAMDWATCHLLWPGDETQVSKCIIMETNKNDSDTQLLHDSQTSSPVTTHTVRTILDICTPLHPATLYTAVRQQYIFAKNIYCDRSTPSIQCDDGSLYRTTRTVNISRRMQMQLHALHCLKATEL
jgi:hypothetical protein